MGLLKFKSNYKDVFYLFRLKNIGIRESSFRFNLEIIEGICIVVFKKVSFIMVKLVFNNKFLY